VVAGALDVRGAQGVGLGGAVFQLGGDGEGGFDGERGEGGDEQLPDLLVESGAGDGLADPAGVFDAVALAPQWGLAGRGAGGSGRSCAARRSRR
jgi:hypothetical protein